MSLLASSILCLSINSWVIIWILLEINTLTFCSSLNTFNNNNKNSGESSIKYFVIQSISSSLLVFSSIISNQNKNWAAVLVVLSVISLSINIAASPFQQWFVNITNKISWKSSTLLITWQKLAPVYLSLFQINILILPFLTLSAILGAISQMNNKAIIEIMAYSSVFNLSWMLLATIVNINTFITFSLIYWASVAMIIAMIINAQINTIASESNETKNNWIEFVIVLNLAGIPPIAGFLAKWLVFNEGLANHLMSLVTSLLVLSSVNLYIYLRMTSNIYSLNTHNQQKNINNTINNTSTFIILFNFIPIVLITL